MMKENSHFYAILSRMKYIDRWNLMRNTRNESLADHTLDVIFITHALVVIANTKFGAKLNEGRAALLAAFHDAPEIITGDLPTPVKYYDPKIKDAYDHVEEAAKAKMISQLPAGMQPIYEELLNMTGPEDKILKKYVKAADKISALIKCIEEEQSGNRDFVQAKEATLRRIKEFQMPEVDYFMESFLPGYYLTLDEQTRNE